MARARKTRPAGDPKLAVAYLRVSKEEQQLGPDAQRAAIELWAAAQGITVASWHFDQLTSVTPTERRPGLMAALLALREKSAGVLVVAKRDRLARDPALTLSIEQITREAGALVLSAAGEGNGDTPADEFMRGVIDSTARYERALIRARTKAALAVKKRRGEVYGKVPFGWRVGKDTIHLEKDPHEQACIAEVLRLHAEGALQKQIGRQLWPHYKTRRGNPFTQTQIRRILLGAGVLKTSLRATVGELAQRNGATSRAGGAAPMPVAPERSVALEVEKATTIAGDGQRLVNRRLVKKPDYLRHGRPADLVWIIGQVRTLVGMGVPSHKIAGALTKTGVRRGDGSELRPADVERWAASA